MTEAMGDEMSSNINNIDIKCAELGRKFAEGKLCARNRAIQERIEEKDITALLTVLETNGPYAMWLYARAKLTKKGKPVGDYVDKLVTDAIAIVEDGGPENLDTDIQGTGTDSGNAQALQNKSSNEADKIIDRAKDLYNYLFFQDILKRALIYAKYHAKAHDTPQGRGSGDSASSGDSGSSGDNAQ